MEYEFSNRMKDLSGTATREILKLTARPEVISFAGGMPARELFPFEQITEIMANIEPQLPRVLQYATSEGFPELLDCFAQYLASLNLTATHDQLLVINGGQQGIDLAIKCLLNDGDVLLTENPTYLATLQIAKSYRVKTVGVDANDEGLILSDLEDKIVKNKAKVLYVVPTFSNPTGKTYSESNRKAIVEICQRHSVIIIEDDPYSRLRFNGEHVAPLKSFDKTGNVLFLSSFSKIISPGLRIAIAYGDKTLIRKLTVAKQGTDVHSSNISQYITWKYLERGFLNPHIEKILPTYKERQKAMLSAIDKHMPSGVTHTVPYGGLFIWCTLPTNIDCESLLTEAIARNVAYVQGNVFYPDGKTRNNMRLNFSNEKPETIECGIKILADLIKEKL